MTPTFGTSMRTARELCNLSMREVEDATGISNAYICQLEGDKIRRPSYFLIGKLCALYGVDERDMMGRLPEMTKLTGSIYPKNYLARKPVTPEEEQELADYLLFMRVRAARKK